MARNGKPIKARRIGGVKVVPKWNWTREYARDVAKHERELSKGRTAFRRWSQGFYDERNAYLEGQYLEWLMFERAPTLTADKADHFIRQQQAA